MRRTSFYIQPVQFIFEIFAQNNHIAAIFLDLIGVDLQNSSYHP